jgi:hypothetical protein
MTTASRLALPIDIPWQRICVAEDMVDRVVCDDALPPKWQSSIAVFKFVPDEEYQVFPDYDVSYLKVTATITGYQALEREIQGTIDWSGLDVTSFEGVNEMLESYFPCTGAIVQVVVGPPGEEPGIPLDSYPFFMDFEPKKRELYEMATDTKERQSRSVETLHVGKSSGSTQSQEVLDVDMGGSSSVGVQASYGGTGGGFSTSSSNQGQWGTKSVNTQQSQADRTREVGQEMRESYSFTTEISQMYHLLDSYHLGTNRAVFFVQPRPHVVEEPTGFVRGPRKVEGIQEFFLVVARPKDTPDYCVSVRLDTGHLVETDMLEYSTRQDVSDIAIATAPIPTEDSDPATPPVKALWRACFGSCWDVRYRCFATHASDDVTYTAPAGFTITSYDNLVSETSHGTSSVSIAPGNRTLTIHAEAAGHIAIEAGWDVCVDCPDELEKWSGSARRQVQVNLRSERPAVRVGTQLQLLVTTRGVCCCADGPTFSKGVVAVHDVPPDIGGRTLDPGAGRKAAGVEAADGPGAYKSLYSPGARTATHALESAPAGPKGADDCCADCADDTGGPRMTPRQANAIGDFIKERMVTAGGGPQAPERATPFVYSEAFTRQLEQFQRRSRRGRELLDRPAADALPAEIVGSVAKRLGMDPEQLSAGDVLGFRTPDLMRMSGAGRDEVGRLRLALLGVPVDTDDGYGPPGSRAD